MYTIIGYEYKKCNKIITHFLFTDLKNLCTMEEPIFEHDLLLLHDIKI